MSIENSVRLSRGEYWLLECLVHYGTSLRSLEDSNVRDQFNKACSHGLSRDDLIATFLRFQSNGWAEYKRYSIGPEACQDELDVTIDQPLLEKYFASAPETDPIRVYLTGQGGAAWEAFARPNWSRYVFHCIDNNGELESNPLHEVEGADRKWIEEYLRCLEPEIEDDSFTIVDSSTICEEVLTPYKPAYWKELPVGYRLKFHMKSVEPTEQMKNLRDCLGRLYRFSGKCWHRDSWYEWRS